MSKRIKKPTAAEKAGGGRKKTKRSGGGGGEDGEEEANFFLLDDDKRGGGGGGAQRAGTDESEDEEARETAEEKRLRLARAYLEQVRAAGGLGGDGDDDDEDEEERRGVTGGRDRLAERLQQDAAEAQGRLQRNLAHRVAVPDQSVPAPRLPRLGEVGTTSSGGSGDEDDSSDDDEVSSSDGDGSSEDEDEGEDGGAAVRRGSARAAAAALPYGAGRFAPGHDLSATALALSADGATAFTVSKDGGIIKWDVETMRGTHLRRPDDGGNGDGGGLPEVPPDAADWAPRPRAGRGGLRALYAAAVSSDGRYLAVGGGDRRVHVFDALTGAHVAAHPGHRDAVTGLAFREAAHTLYSSSYDRTVKIWSVSDGAYVDTLFGHQAEVYAVDALRQERAVTSGHDRTCRVWKIPEESHLLFRAQHPSVGCVRYITGTEFLSGADDGSLQVWSQMKKKPVAVVRGAHSAAAAAGAGQAEPAGGSWATAGSEAVAWVQSVAVARGTDLAASGAGDGRIRLWAVEPSKHGSAGGLKPVGELPALGFVNGLAIERHGRFVAAALGAEPRLGRWARVEGAVPGLLVHPLNVAPEE